MMAQRLLSWNPGRRTMARDYKESGVRDYEPLRGGPVASTTPTSPDIDDRDVRDEDEDYKDDGDLGSRRVVRAHKILGKGVKNPAGEDVGKIEDIMIDMPTGRIAYAVLSFGGFLGMGNKLFAIPWEALSVNEREKHFVLDVIREKLERAPGFDKDHWPDMADQTWGAQVYTYYGYKPYWERGRDYDRGLLR
jgi:sporulation protein YlmC with PRC-barrel domain